MTLWRSRAPGDAPVPRQRRGSAPVGDTSPAARHSALVPPGLLHQRVSSALTNWQLDDAEALLQQIDGELPPAPVPDRGPAPLTSLARAWADTLRAELLVRRLRLAGYSLLGDPLVEGGPEQDGPLDLNPAPVGAGPDAAVDRQPRTESASHAAEAIALVRSARAAFDAQGDDLQRAAGLVRHARIELLSRRVDAAMDEAVEAASLLDPGLPPTPLLVHTLGSLAAVLADLELMPLALDYQHRAEEVAAVLAADPGRARDRRRPGGRPGARRRGRDPARRALRGAGRGAAGRRQRRRRRTALRSRRAARRAGAGLLPDGDPGVLDAQVVRGWALVGLGESRRRGRPAAQRRRRRLPGPGAAGLRGARPGPRAAPVRGTAGRRRPPGRRAGAGHRARPAAAAPGRAAGAVHAARRAGRRRPGAALPAGLPGRRAGPGRRAAHPLGRAVRPAQEPAGDRAGRRVSCAARPTRTR